MTWYTKYPDETFTQIYEEKLEVEKEKAAGDSDAHDGEVMEANA